MSNVILIGPMGAGKTTVGRQLGRKLHRDFFDSDKEIEQRTGVDIRTIFEYEGEAGFREREAKVIEELTRKNNIVLATGGGAPMNEANRTCFNSRGHVILLNVSVDEQIARTRLDKTRPLLQTENPRETLEKLRQVRLPIYRSIADLEVNSNNRNMRNVIGKICQFLQEHKNGQPSAKTL